MNIRSAALLAAIIPAATAISPARAQSIDMELGAGPAILEFPRHRFFGLDEELPPLERIRDLETDDGRQSGAFVSGHLGISLPLAWSAIAAFGGRIEGSYYDASGTTAADFFDDDSDTNLAWTPFEGPGTSTFDGDTLATATERDIRYRTLSPVLTVRLATPTGTTLGAFAGPSFRSLDQITRATGSIRSNTVELNEELETNYAGAGFGIEGSRTVGANWSLSGSAAVSVYSAETDYLGRYQDSDGRDQRSRLEAEDVGYGLDLTAAATRRFGNRFDVTAFAELSHLSFAPQIRYLTNGGGPGGDGVRITDGSLSGYGIGLSLSARF